jgi:NhaP-type Na+/H+ or K+/H+ antiporter
MAGAISDGEKDSESIVLLILVGILLGAVTNYALSAWRNSSSFYHPLIFIEGIIIGQLHQASNADLSISRAIESWVKVDSELLLYIFLPAIVFRDSVSVHWRQIKGALPQAMILSFPGVIAGSYILGASCFLMFPLGWSWYEAMLLGTILSAIDPAAVIEEMNDTGASKKLIAMMLTEGIFTDGTAIMFFLLIYDIMSGSSQSVAEIIGNFAYEIFVSFAIGGVLGYLFVRFLRMFKRSLMAQDVFIQLALTLCSAYLSFFLGQSVFHVSGTWSCTATAIIVSWKGAPIILDPESMRIFWGVVVWLASTMIYLIAGLIFSMRTLDNIQAINWLYLFLLYLVVLSVRAITVLASFPIIKDAGNKCSLKEALFIIFAASRGPPSLIMAILVEQNYEYLNISSEDASNIFFFVGGIVALSIVINGNKFTSVHSYPQFYFICFN